jgi:hypothetical protein
VIEAAICKAGGLEGREKQFDERTLEAADPASATASACVDLLTIAARENGYTAP